MDGSGRLKVLFEVQLLPAVGPRAARHGCFPLTSILYSVHTAHCTVYEESLRFANSVGNWVVTFVAHLDLCVELVHMSSLLAQPPPATVLLQ